MHKREAALSSWTRNPFFGNIDYLLCYGPYPEAITTGMYLFHIIFKRYGFIFPRFWHRHQSFYTVMFKHVHQRTVFIQLIHLQFRNPVSFSCISRENSGAIAGKYSGIIAGAAEQIEGNLLPSAINSASNCPIRWYQRSQAHMDMAVSVLLLCSFGTAVVRVYPKLGKCIQSWNSTGMTKCSSGV